MYGLSPSEDIKILVGEPLSKHSSMKTGGSADFAAFPTTREALLRVVREADTAGLRRMVIGNATNLLFDDAGFPGLVIFTAGLRGITWEENTVTAECGVSLTALAGEAAKRGLSGLEFAYGIPGTVGGAVYMNAGAYGAEIADVLLSSEYLAGGSATVRHKEAHAFSYRSSIYRKTDETILSATFTLTPSTPAEVLARSKENMRARQEKQPLDYPNAGSIFKRPAGTFAGVLIEKAGLKGLRVGGAEVSEKHAGFIVNRGGATTDDVLRLISLIQKKVWDSAGVLLEPEVIHVK